MNYSDFQTNLVTHLNALTSPGVCVQVQLIKKNNTADRIGLVLYDEHEPEQMVSPIVYPDELYRDYLKGTPMEDLLENAWQMLHFAPPRELDLHVIENRDYVLNHAVLRLVGKQRNEVLLKEAFFREFLDFAVTIGLLMLYGEKSCAVALMPREAFELLEITEDELCQHALENTRGFFGDQMLDMNIMLHHPGKDAEIDPKHLEYQDHGQYVLTNRRHYYGATALLYSDKLRQLSESLKKDLLILPSSIHELVLFPESGQEDLEYLRSLVQNVNQSEIPDEEILTDNVYRYSRARNRVELAESEAFTASQQ